LFEFIQFLRVVAIGLISLILFGVTLYKSVFYIEATWIIMISTLLGLIIEPFLRAYHPFRKEIRKVIKHVEIYIKEAILQEDEKLLSNIKTENALARAIYEYCIRTFQSAETFTTRVNEQIRFFYFYYFISIALKISSLCIVFVLLIKGVTYTNLLQFSPSIMGFVRNEFLMGINNVVSLIFISISFIVASLLLAHRFHMTAKGIILNELDTRHIFLLDQKQKIQNLARLAQKDEMSFRIFKEAVDKEKGIRR
jgi:hypothetical protein